MAYPAPFHRLVMIGEIYGDVWNTTLALIPVGGVTLPPVSDALLEAMRVTVGGWFDNPLGGGSPTGVGFIAPAKLTSIKLNRIGTDGKYMDAETKEHVYTTPVAGPVANNIAPQLSVALSLHGSNERARAGRGRMYFPPNGVTVPGGSDGRLAAADALSIAKGYMFLMGAINDTYLAQGVDAVPGISSRTGAGAFQGLDHVSVGRVIDTVRSRRNKLDEDRQSWGSP